MLQTEESIRNDLQVVLLGWHKSGKTSIIKNILGPNVTVEVSGQCVKTEGYVNGRKVTLVDTPGWWKHCSIQDSSELTKQAIVQSVTLCPSRPQAFLLVIEANVPFKEKYIKPLVQFLELLTEKVWAHTLVLFTGVDTLSIKEQIQNQGEPLQTLLHKCGNRFHAFGDINKCSNAQVSELFEKIEDVVRINGGRNFYIDLEVLQEHQRKWDEVQRRAAVRQAKVQQERSRIKQKANVHHLEELRIVLLGWMMSGKSSAGNIILNKKEFKTETQTTTCKEGTGYASGRKVTVMDTPSWWKFFKSEFNPESVPAAVLKGIAQCKKFPHAMLLVIPADTSFMEEHIRTIEENMAIFGEQIWRHTIVLFTAGDLLGDVLIEHHIESEGQALQWLIDKCGNRYHLFDNMKYDDDVQVAELLEKIEEMVAGNCLFRPGVREVHEEETELPPDTYEKNQVSEVLKLIKKEWNKRAMEFQKYVEKLLTRKAQSAQSLTPPPGFPEEDPSPEVNIQQTLSNQVCKLQKESEGLIKLLSVLEREWNRQETMVMEKVHAALLKGEESSSEVDEQEIKSSVAKVLWWLPGCEDSRETSRNSDPEEGSAQI